LVEQSLLPILCIIFVATLVRSTFGFGDALVGMPLLALVVSLKTATPLIALVAWTIGFGILIGNWKNVRFRSAWRLILSTLAGIPIGLLLLKGIHDDVMKVMLGATIVLFAVYALGKPRSIHIGGDRCAYIFGFFAGILGGAYNTNGPPVVAYGLLRRWPPEAFRTTLQAYFISTGLLILAGHCASGLWTRSVLLLYLICLPVVILAIVLGGIAHRSIPSKKFEKIVHVFLLLLGALLISSSVNRLVE